ncbi:hairy and enhancer of split related-7 isoform X2 [Danio aesculapii]|uniref:hairy and enhancer of split related-7 isoform X2 n=1 Tax=Danio aesculapii TaxID=1142201 RepID=UPI0024BFD1C3|nr:hairy and enhancer of split related-7 isoform X2 [Danio aesculapii]
MKILAQTEKIKMERKLLKPQVERRRRERMNRSLENLKLLLLQGPEHNQPNQRRLEKAEILEYTVLFLQKANKANKEEEGEEKSQFMEGFSSCLQKAARYLLDEGGLEGSVTSMLCQRLAHPTIRLPVRSQVSSRKQHAESNAQHHVRRPHHKNTVSKAGHPSACRNAKEPQADRAAFRSTDSNAKHSTAQPTSHHPEPASQTVWRPWP